MKPILYSPGEWVFNTNGIGVLTDAISCKVKQVLNGQYELTMQYPVKGLHFGQIIRRRIILAKVDPVSDLQPFRIYRITKPSSGIVTIYARHIAYDLNGITVLPFTATTGTLALLSIAQNAVPNCPFNFSMDTDPSPSFKVPVPTAIWKVLGGTEGSLLDVYGGEYEFDRWDVKLLTRRGMDRGVSIRYGKNLTSLEQDENCANCYTGVLPYWVDQNTNEVFMLRDRTVAAEGTFGYTKILPLDLSGKFEQKPSEAELKAAAKAYMTDNKICEPVVSWRVEFVQLEQTEEYKGMALLERVLLGDTVEVVFDELDISVKSRAVSCQYDSILERYDHIDLGSVRANIADTIASQNKDISAKPNKSEMQLAIERLTGSILGARGGAVRFLDTDGDGLQDTLYIADNADPALAVKVWRFNYEGWAASSNGYNGPFIMGATLDGGILAEFIKAGVLQSADGKIQIFLNAGASGPIFNTGISTNGLTVRGDAVGAPQVFSVAAVENNGKETVVVNVHSAAGALVGYLQELFSGSAEDATGVRSGLVSPNGARELLLYADNTESGVRLLNGATVAGKFTLDADGKARLRCDEIEATGSVTAKSVDATGGMSNFSTVLVDQVNPGKHSLYTGTVTPGSSFTVPDTGNYDLFAIRLGDENNAELVAVLAYKVGDTIRGVGGWAGNESTPKTLYFVSANFAGNSWILVDANKQSISASGSVGSATSLCIKEVIGII